jgi:DNA-directed RNA polymerase specialized sigma24 family protein
MKYGKSYEFYGKLNVKSMNNAVHDIWLSRHTELPEIPTSPLPGPLIAPDDYAQLEIQDFVQKAFEYTAFNKNEGVVVLLRMAGYTLVEIGQMLGVTRARVREIEANALRRLKDSFKRLERNLPPRKDRKSKIESKT